MLNFSKTNLNDLFKIQVENNHRTIFITSDLNIENNLCDFLSDISYLKTVIWCFKNNESKVKSSDCFIKKYKPEYISYKEINKVLGRTCDLLILQDFDSLRPNVLACAIETVNGGGIIILILKDNEYNNINSIFDKKVLTFNDRLLKSLIASPFSAVTDLKSIKLENIVKSQPIDNNDSKFIDNTVDIESQPIHNNVNIESKLIDVCKTKDQKDVLMSLISHINKFDINISSIVSKRGRGKSATLGLAIASGIDQNLPLIVISSLFLDNVQVIFKFILIGLKKLGYTKNIDYKIIYTSSKEHGKLINKIEIIKNYKREVVFVQSLEELKLQPSLLVIDEAASIPLANLKKLLNSKLIFMASTANGYEGTGRTFRIKLSEYISEKYKNNTSYEMNDPIRYSKGDGVEEWLSKALILDPTPNKIIEEISPKNCKLYHINKEILFDGSEKSEKILNEIFSLFISSHYRNSPNDIQVLADSPNHEIFVLKDENTTDKIFCAIQVAFEGECKDSISKEGNLIPWVLYENFYNENFLQEIGVRIVRIAVHHSLLSKNYGSTALEHLFNILSNNNDIVDDTKNILFNSIDSIKIKSVSWIGASFGLSEKLLNFWKKSSFSPVCIRQIPSKTTGEVSVVVIKNIGNKLENDFRKMKLLFLQRFISLISYAFNTLPTTLLLSLIYSSDEAVTNKDINFTVDEIERLKMFVDGMVDVKSVVDILHDLSRYYFYQNDINQMNIASQAVLLMIGCQRKTVDEITEDLKIDYFKVIGLLSQAIKTILHRMKYE